jgi:crossover junction endodeoxyribonuclease RusA
VIELPYPHKSLWPNGRFHWSVKAREVKKHRRAAWAVALPMRNSIMHGDGLIPIAIICHPKARGPAPDRDGIVSAAKSYIDGIADAIGINDCRFAAPTVEISPDRSGKFVIHIG